MCARGVAAAVALCLVAALPAAADEDPSPSAATQASASPAPSSTTPTDGGVERGEVTRPNPHAPGTQRTRVLVMGDSISAGIRYSAHSGDPERPRAWWAYVAEAASLPPSEVMRSAESGSGVLMRGSARNGITCSGSTFGERLGDIETTRPDIVLVEVGRNDVRACDGPRPRPATQDERRATAIRFFDDLARAVDRQGVDRANVYVLTPWGSVQSPAQVAVTTLYEALARARGFAWVPVPALAASHTTDGTHPNAAGSRAIAVSVMRASDVVTAIASRGRLHVPTASRTSVVCTGIRSCRATGVRVATPLPRRVWGAAPRTPAHHVAQALTTGRTVAPVLGAATPRGWRVAAWTERAAKAVAHARPGDVAWWRDAPASVGRQSGHVAVVRRVAADNSWVQVTETTARGTVRAVRYSGVDLPRAYLRFTRTDGSPRGLVSSVRGRPGAVTVSGRAVDTDAPRRGVRLRVKVTQGTRTWTRTTPRAVRTRFSQRFVTPGLRAGRATVRVVALDAPRTRGTNRTLATQRLTVR